jgi:hypothetical protein
MKLAVIYFKATWFYQTRSNCLRLSDVLLNNDAYIQASKMETDFFLTSGCTLAVVVSVSVSFWLPKIFEVMANQDASRVDWAG